MTVSELIRALMKPNVPEDAKLKILIRLRYGTRRVEIERVEVTDDAVLLVEKDDESC